MSVAILPYGLPNKHFCKLDQVLLEAIEWPLNDRPEGQLLSDLGAHDHLLIFASSKMLTMRTDKLRCQVSVILCEPPAIQGKLYHALRLMSSRFRYVLTHNTRLLSQLPNARFLAFGDTFLEVTEQPIVEKTERISLIASSKRRTVGQRLRHDIVKWAAENATDLVAMGRGYRELSDKADGHAPYMFSVVIENTSVAGFFTEKLIDCLLCRCLPIYWGPPDIEHFFDSRGMILCKSAADIRHAVQTVTSADYAEREVFLEQNRLAAMQYLNIKVRAARCVEDFASNLAISTESLKDKDRNKGYAA